MIHLALCFRALEHWVEIAGHAEDERTGEIWEMTWELSYPDYVMESQASIETQRQIREWAQSTGASEGLIDFKPSLLPLIGGRIFWCSVQRYFSDYVRNAEPSALKAAKKIVKSRIAS
jgi:hypothetical protein